MSAIPAKPSPVEEASSKNRSLNCQDTGVNPRKKIKVCDDNDEGKRSETAVSRETNDAESYDANDTLETSARDEADELASYAIMDSEGCDTLAAEHLPPPLAPSLLKCYEDANHSQVGSNISREEVLPKEEPDFSEGDDDTRCSPSSKKRQRSAFSSPTTRRHGREAGSIAALQQLKYQLQQLRLVVSFRQPHRMTMAAAKMKLFQLP